MEINSRLYDLLKTESYQLRDEGFSVVFMGDFNGHLGKKSVENPNGIEGDLCDQNQNGKLLLDFTDTLGLEILNGMELCKGTYTRIEGGRLSIVDFGLVESEMLHRIRQFNIDESKQLAQGSDHCLLSMSLAINENNVSHSRDADLHRFQTKEGTNFTKFTNMITKTAEDSMESYKLLSLDSKAEFVEDLIVGTAKKCFKRKFYPVRAKPEMKLPKWAKKKLVELNTIRTLCTGLELRIAKGEKGLDKELASHKADREGKEREVQAMLSRVRLEQRMRIRRLNLKPTTDAKQFWRLASIKTHGESQIKSFKTKKGELVLDQDRIERSSIVKLRRSLMLRRVQFLLLEKNRVSE